MDFKWKDTQPGSLLAPAKVLPVLRAAVVREPDALNLRLTLAQALFNADAVAEIVTLLEPLACKPGVDPNVDFHLGRALATLGQSERAVPYLDRAAENYVPGAHGELARALHALKRDDEAKNVAASGLEHEPSDLRCLRAFAAIHFARGEARIVYDRCKDLWAKGVRHGQVVSARAQAATLLGFVDESESLFDTDIWYCETRLESKTFTNEGLKCEILGSENLRPSHPYISTRGDARRIDNFQATEGPNAEMFHGKLKCAIESYLEQRARFANHPIIESRPEVMNLVSWALVMRGDGYEGWHDHALAWLSGVYYVTIPAPASDGNALAGHIGFRKTPIPVSRPSDETDWTLMPSIGTLLLFPSYMPHRTWATEVSAHRISIAFNVFPA